VVDDDDSVRKTTCRLLKSLGYEVLAAGDGIEALNLARSHEGPIDILLCDVAMPGQSGPEVAQNVLGVRSTIRVLFVSGYPEGKESVISAHGFLQKPYTRASLGDKLQSLWKGSHTTH
jgi:two-component system, cell cycle sensor histidine kinase and response regulator CckA